MFVTTKVKTTVPNLIFVVKEQPEKMATCGLQLELFARQSPIHANE